MENSEREQVRLIVASALGIAGDARTRLEDRLNASFHAAAAMADMLTRGKAGDDVRVISHWLQASFFTGTPWASSAYGLALERESRYFAGYAVQKGSRLAGALRNASSPVQFQLDERSLPRGGIVLPVGEQGHRAVLVEYHPQGNDA